jgi:DNA-nicking Smr family endonuclease
MRKPPEDDDFRRALDGVEPLAEPRRKPPARTAPAPVPRQTRRDERAALAESLAGPLSLDDALDSGEELVFLRPGLGRDVLRKLRRGHWVIQGELDLHGMNRTQAAEAVSEFLHHCLRRGVRCVRIVHGKGLGSRNREPVLKGLLRKWLLREAVLAYCQAPATEGGSGAVLVLLKP